MNLSVDNTSLFSTTATNKSMLGGVEYISHNLWLYIPYLALFSTGILAGIVGNMLIIGTILYMPKLRENPTFVMILNLSASDLAVSVAVDSFTLVGTLAGEEFFIQSPFWCQFSGAMCIIACGTSLVSMAFLAINRYVCILHPNLYKQMFTIKKTVFYCMLGWATGIAFNLPNFVPGWAEYNFDSKELTCASDRKKKVYAMIFSGVGIVVPCLSIGVLYSRIFCYSLSVKQRLAENRSRSRARMDAFRLAKSLFASYILFFICWMPLAIVILIDTDDVMPTEMHMYLYVLAHLNSAMNPIFYAAFNPKIKESYKRFLNYVSLGIFYQGIGETKSLIFTMTQMSQTKFNVNRVDKQAKETL